MHGQSRFYLSIYFITARKKFPKAFFSVASVIFFFFFFFVTTITRERLSQSEPNFHTRLLTEIARPCAKIGVHRSHVIPLIGSFSPRKLTYLRFQPIQTKFSHMTFDCNSSSEFENGYQRSNVAPPNTEFLPPEISNPPNLMEFKPKVLATK